MKNKILIFIFIFLLSGCIKTDYIQIVKNGVLNIDNSLNIGQAFDNWNECQNKEWKTNISSNGRTVVEYTCNLQNIKSEIESIFINNQITKKEFSYLNLDKVTFNVRWAMNADKNSFSLDDIQIIYAWNDGLEKKYNLDESTLKAIYKNSSLNIHNDLKIQTFKKLAFEYYKSNELIILLEETAEYANLSFSQNKNKILEKAEVTPEIYSAIKNSTSVEELYIALQEINIKSKQDTISYYISSILFLSTNDDTDNTPIAIKLLKMYSEDTENISNKKLLMQHITISNIEPYLSRDKMFFYVISYILNKPSLKNKLQTEPDDQHRTLLTIDTTPPNSFKTSIGNDVINILLDNNIKPTFDELVGLEEIKITSPIIYKRLNTIKEDYIKNTDKKYNLSFNIYLPSKEYRGLTIDFNENAKTFFSVMENKEKNKEKIKEWHDKYQKDVLNKTISKVAKKEFMNLLELSECSIKYYE